jgi:TPR repeat protein
MSLLLSNASLTDHGDAAALLQSAADAGFAPAQTALATAYEHGSLGTPDIQLAIQWYTRAANQGDWIAQLSLGRILFRGSAVPRDTSAAKRWFVQAAASGDGASALYLGRLYDEGEATTNYPEAAKWYRQSAEAGNPFAQERLALLLLKGLFGPSNKPEAYAWLLVAVEFGNHRALQELQSMESDIGKTGADAARRQALEMRDQILGKIARDCGRWDGQYADSPTPPPLRSQPSCERLKHEAAAN